MYRTPGSGMLAGKGTPNMPEPMEAGVFCAGTGSGRLTAGRGRSGLAGADAVVEPAGLIPAARAPSALIVETGSVDVTPEATGSPDGLREPGLTETNERRGECPPEGDGPETVGPAGADGEAPSVVDVPAVFEPPLF
jgi:hypothetical protein